ncbi:unnamed protein product [Sphenostylis stenocarpa]|uniref:Uncharacterized protein n=1 Tax=Sphenostylis stenocarpa TaxID=92480 RepID=A0AA86T7D2_9FABA|nr:unnamed protein product [Sphenostylis stenocarpa]
MGEGNGFVFGVWIFGVLSMTSITNQLWRPSLLRITKEKVAEFVKQNESVKNSNSPGTLKSIHAAKNGTQVDATHYGAPREERKHVLDMDIYKVHEDFNGDSYSLQPFLCCVDVDCMKLKPKINNKVRKE